MRPFARLLLLIVFCLAAARPLRAGDAPYRYAAGVNLGGAQLDWRINRRWMVEARLQSGTDTTGGATTRSQVAGIRGYRFFGARNPALFAGLQASAAKAKRSGSAYEASGWATGVFAGLEVRLFRHLFLMADGGPYVVSLREKDTGISQGNVTFVADLALVVGF